MRKNRLIGFCFVLTFLIAGCTGSSTPGSPNLAANGRASGSNSNSQGLSGLTRGKLANYSATFDIKFDGPVKWTYQLKDLKSPKLQELDLHITGIDKSQNPGDIRSVSDGSTTWMIGPGTDNQCVQFQNNHGMDPSYVFPESLLSFQQMSTLVSYLGQDTVAGRPSTHYRGASPSTGSWKDAHIDVWQDTASGELLQFTMQASGDDSIFGTGSGKIDAHYQVNDLHPVTINPVAGCNLDAPLPKAVKNFVRLPGLASFESASSVNQVASFYQSELPKQNWVQKDPPDLSNGSAALSYQRAAESLEIQITPVASGGCKVKLLFQQGN